MNISVVIATYNGEKYLTEQLDSIRNQSRTADEVIICDDGSTDSTNKLIDQYINKYSLNEWKHVINEKNVGWKVNFMQAINMSHGDIIFTCDQDDIWYKNKLEIMGKIMQENEKIGLLAANYDLKYKDKEKVFHADKLKQYVFEKKFIYIKRPGCVYCFRKKLFNVAEKMWFEDYPHDALIWRQALLDDSLYLYEEPLIYWRRHEGTATGHDKKSTSEKIKSLEYYIKVLDKMSEYIKNNKVRESEIKNVYIIKCRKWCKLRMEFLNNGKITLWIKLFGYIKYYFSFKSYLGDFVIRKIRR